MVAMPRAVALDRQHLPDVGTLGWSMMRRGVATSAFAHWLKVGIIGHQVCGMAPEFQACASVRELTQRSVYRVR
jgi:hypothetical protein